MDSCLDFTFLSISAFKVQLPAQEHVVFCLKMNSYSRYSVIEKAIITIIYVMYNCIILEVLLFDKMRKKHRKLNL